MAEQQQKFPTEVIDLPSKGKVYPKDSPLSKGKVEVKYMTTKEEDILTSQNLLKKGVAIDVLLNSLIVTEGVSADDLIIGDKNAVMVACRILAYGPEYITEITHDNGKTETVTFDLTKLEFKLLPEDVKYADNLFEFVLPVSQEKIKYKILDGRDEKDMSKELEALEKAGQVSEMSTRLKYTIKDISGETDINKIGVLVQSMLARDSLALRTEMNRVAPDIIMEQEVQLEGGDTAEVNIPLAVEFFWPKA
tara:strand:- start:275 stop:1024 length:750 start_codon:yes stop_codon:yes gene_type:complete